MDILTQARSIMAMSLSFHIVFASISMTMPLLMVLAELRWLRSGRLTDLKLAKRWQTATAILFAAGALSGTILAFELGMFWPEFMRRAGPIVAIPFSMESFCFFIEAIFLALYSYGWRYLPRWFHLICGCIVVLSSWGSAAFITAVNGWMNTPQGFELLVDGQWLLRVENFRDLAALGPAMETTLQKVFPMEVILNPSFKSQVSHVILGSLGAVSFSLASIHAWMILRNKRVEFHTRALHTVLPVAIVTSILLPITGDLSARFLAEEQPIKLAAAEAHFETSSHAGLWIGGIANEETREVEWGFQIPNVLSIMIGGSPDTVVVGLDAVPEENWPNVRIVHGAFQIMVGCGMVMLLLGLTTLILRLKFGQWTLDKRLLQSWFICGPLGFIAMQAGWIVTEVGRQPWVIRHWLRTSEAVATQVNPGPFGITLLCFYLFLSLGIVIFLSRFVFRPLTIEPLPETHHA